MSEKLQKLISRSIRLEPSAELRERILLEIRRISERRLQMKLRLAYAGIASSLIMAFLSIISAYKRLAESDFWQVFSLLFSDLSVIARNWQEFFLSLEETFPLGIVFMILIPIFILLLSLAFYFDNSHPKNISSQHSHSHA